MRRHRRKRPQSEEVRLNLAAMLDMAFQLLAFFILTFRPNPVEGQIALNLPPAERESIRDDGPRPEKPGPEFEAGAKTLTIVIPASKDGQVASVSVGLAKLFDGPLDRDRLQQLNRRLKGVFSVQDAFDQVVLRVGTNLNYGELMKIVEVCTKQKMSDGKPVSKISFVELPEN
jgi:biopolymer transport protein ExbD